MDALGLGVEETKGENLRGSGYSSFELILRDAKNDSRRASPYFLWAVSLRRFAGSRAKPLPRSFARVRAVAIETSGRVVTAPGRTALRPTLPGGAPQPGQTARVQGRAHPRLRAARPSWRGAGDGGDAGGACPTVNHDPREKQTVARGSAPRGAARSAPPARARARAGAATC